MFAKLLVSFLILCIVFQLSEGRCKCEYLLKHYDELGCKPVYEKEDDCCPIYYDCNDLLDMRMQVSKESTTPSSGCHFRGINYQDQQPINNNITRSFCKAGCYCDSGNVICAQVDCKEFFGDKLEPSCYRQYKHNHCCSTGTKCPPFDNLAICQDNKKVYHEGQKFYPEQEPCLTCICQEGFVVGKYEQPYCVPINCNFEPKIKELQEFCVPIYYGTKRCCPSHWFCPNDKESQNVGEARNEKADKTKMCFYGKRMLKIGEKFTMQKDTYCSCTVPPLATCIKNPQINN